MISVFGSLGVQRRTRPAAQSSPPPARLLCASGLASSFVHYYLSRPSIEDDTGEKTTSLLPSLHTTNTSSLEERGCCSSSSVHRRGRHICARNYATTTTPAPPHTRATRATHRGSLPLSMRRRAPPFSARPSPPLSSEATVPSPGARSDGVRQRTLYSQGMDGGIIQNTVRRAPPFVAHAPRARRCAVHGACAVPSTVHTTRYTAVHT